jgi:hypothetical protein
MNTFHRITGLLPLGIALFATGASSYAGATAQNEPLMGKVRAATERFREINVAIAEGWVQGTPCVSGPDTGAMGVHFVQPARIAAGTLQADEPEALIYEPMPGGAFRLVGVEFIVLASVWQSKHAAGTTPAMMTAGRVPRQVGAQRGQVAERMVRRA